MYGPYVNHNHYAGLMELLIPIPLVLALSGFLEHKGRIAAGIGAAVMVGTIFLSGSRGGMLAIVVELLIFATLLFRRKKRVQFAIGTAAFVIFVVGLLAWLGGKELTTRVSSISTEARSEISGGVRLSIDRDALQMFRRKPILGWGLGTFPVAYPRFRSFYTNFFVNEAHNDYLQMLVEMGLLGFGVVVWFATVLYRRAFTKNRGLDIRCKQRRYARHAPWVPPASWYTAFSISTCRFPRMLRYFMSSAASPRPRRCCSDLASESRSSLTVTNCYPTSEVV